MSRSSTPDVKTVCVAVLAGLAAVWVGFSGLSLLATPANLKARLAAIEATAGRIDAAPRQIGDPSAYAPHALCHASPRQAADALKTALAGSAATAGIAAPRIAVTPPDAAEAGGRLTPVLFQIDAAGRYDSVLALLRLLDQAEPEVFADTLDLKSQTSTVSLKLTGRVLCQTSA